ncbi:hypothetical protein XB05_17330 [Xanthomonas arboricola]|uniref:hypothetical protein n=1 Tax=Xanthomonas arboricola TaxID=56448 RepID=UPI00061A11CD|nr:hypothetical protein [Xanthomonas arboricola]AKC81476.1 hypothetical protein XB05_17330 [Xanthomonas arboricola]
MEKPRKQLERWAQSLCQDVSIGGLIARCPVAHKWKAPYRSIVVREALLWRMHDLGQQTLLLAEHKHILGARILLRSAIETLGVLIYVNQKTKGVLAGNLSFFDFEEITKKLLMGSKNEATPFSAINIITVLAQADKAHSGLAEMHQKLSESAHPNYDGVLYGYSSTDPDKYETRFLNNWLQFFGMQQEPAAAFVFAVFEHEYNDIWPQQLEQLEEWLRANDAALEAQLAGI